MALGEAAAARPPGRMERVRRARILRPLIGGVMFLVALRIVFEQLHRFRYHDAAAYLGTIGIHRIGLAVLATAVSYLALASYDVLALRYCGQALPMRRTAFASFVSSAVSNSVGMSGLAGGSLRYRLYTSWGLPATVAARVIAFGMATFWLGFTIVGGTVLTIDPFVLPRGAGPLVLIVPVTYLIFVILRPRWASSGRRNLALPSRRLAVLQIGVATIDWIAAAVAFAVLLPPGTVGLPEAMAVFLAGQVLGVISSLPGGVGVFEATVLSLLSPRVGAGSLAGVAIAYRAIYYLVPLIVAGGMLAAQEILRRRKALGAIGRGVARTVSLFTPTVMAMAAFLAGVVLLASGATPAQRVRTTILRTAVPLPLVEIAHLAGSMAGVGLLLLARGLQRRLNGAWVLSVALLGVGMAASLAKGLDYEEASLMALVVVLLVPCRPQFYRKTALLDEPFTAGWAMAIALTVASTLWLGLFAYRRIDYTPELWWRFSFSADAPRFLRASVGVAIVALAFSIRKLLHSRPPELVSTSAEDVERAAAIARRHPSPCGFLVLTGDKTILFNDSKTAFLMYGVQGRSWVAMGDPIGPPGEAQELAWSFFENADRHNAWPVFYQVRPANLPLYIELGLNLLKVGEEARVRVAGFSLNGRERKSLRHTVCRMEREGLTFEIVPPDGFGALLPELRRISAEWLAIKSTREKRFSVGAFDEEYLRRLPMAIVRERDEILAFADLWGDDRSSEMTVDLMRHTAAAPTGAMDFLFAKLILHAHRLGYEWFNLGIAPLSGMEARKQGPLWGRIAALGVEHGGRFYNFQGLRRFKEKFDPVWEPVFLACPGGFRLPRILTDIAALGSGGVRGIFGK